MKIIGSLVGIVFIALSVILIMWLSIIPYRAIKQMIIEHKKKSTSYKRR